MTDIDKSRRQSSSLTIWVISIITLPVSYLLFSGPAVWLFQHGYGRNVLPFIYKPLIWLEMSNTPLGRLLGWYWSLWK